MTHHIPFDYMHKFMIDVFVGIGVPEDEAKTCADVLIASDKRGIDSHGIGRLKPIYYDRIVQQKIQQPTTEFEVDGISGATRTSNGISNMLRFWLGPGGFGPFLTRLKEEGL